MLLYMKIMRNTGNFTFSVIFGIAGCSKFTLNRDARMTRQIKNDVQPVDKGD